MSLDQAVTVLRYALGAVAADAATQARADGDRCVMCALGDDFRAALERIRAAFPDHLTEPQDELLDAVSHALAAVPAADHVCFKTRLLERPSWAEARGAAAVAATVLGWMAPDGAALDPVAPGVWNRD